MKTIGMIGGMSWESTKTYYRVINEHVSSRLGGLHSAKILLHSVDFFEIEECQSMGNWRRAARILTNSAISLEKAGAELLILCTNTMHKVAGEISASVKIPFLHIADATARRLNEAGCRKAGLLGTKYTLTDGFYRDRMASQGIDVILPEDNEIGMINSIIFDELCKGIARADSRRNYLDVIENLKRRGADSIILGCNEIGMLVSPDSVELPVFDTTVIHAHSAAMLALEE